MPLLLPGLLLLVSAVRLTGTLGQQLSMKSDDSAATMGLNAKDFGAVGDGAADDWAALQRAINSSQLQGRALLLPAGTYRAPRSRRRFLQK